MGSGDETLRPPKGAKADGVPPPLTIEPKFVGERGLVERCVVTLAGERGLLLVGEPGTAKSMLSELLAAAVCGTSVAHRPGHRRHHRGPAPLRLELRAAAGQGPIGRRRSCRRRCCTAMRRGALVRIEEVTRCLPEVQDALVSILSERRLAVPELAGETDDATEYAAPGFNVIATANLRDRGVSEMSAALKRRFNFETVEPIADRKAEIALVRRQAASRGRARRRARSTSTTRCSTRS